jgi:hypothetical protein
MKGPIPLTAPRWLARAVVMVLCGTGRTHR